MPLDKTQPFTINLSVNNSAVTLAITAAVAEALSSNEAVTQVTITTPGACTLYGRYKSGAAAVKGVDNFPIVLSVSSSGTISVRDGANVGGSLPAGWTGRFYGYLVSAENPTGTDVFQSNQITTPTTSSDVAPSNIRWTSGGTTISVSETAPVGEIIGTVIADGTPTPSFSETADPDSKFTVAVNGQVTLSAALDYGVDTSHSLTVQASNAAGSPTQGLTINVTEAASGGGGGIDETADYVVATPAAFLTLVSGWTLSGGVRQVPEGRAVLVQFTGHATTEFVMPHKFSHLVTLRGIGPYTMGYGSGLLTGGCGAEIRARMNVDGASNFRLALTKVALPDNGLDNNGGLYINGTTDVTFEQCWLSGPEFAVASGSGVRWITQPGLTSGNTRLTFRYVHLSYASEALFNLKSGNVDCVMEMVTMSHTGHDCIKWTGSGNIRPVLRDVWFNRTLVAREGDKHTDMLQTQSGDYTDEIIEYCVGWYGKRLNGNDSSYQSLFQGGTSVHASPTVRHVQFMGNHQNAIYMAAVTGTASLSYYCLGRYEMGASGSTQGYSFPRTSGWSSKSYGYIAGSTTAYVDTHKGTNGDGIALGDVPNPNFSVYTSSGDFSGIPRDDTFFSVMLPPSTSSRRHWATVDGAGPTGDAFLLKRVFVDMIHPGDRWPTALPWHMQYNADKEVPVPVGYTGTFTFDGDGIVSAATTASYDDNGLCLAA